MLISRNRSRRGAPSEEDEGVVSYDDSSESRSNEVLDDLYNQHCVAKRKESILLIYCRFISIHNKLLAGEGAYEHYEGALGRWKLVIRASTALNL